MHPLKRINPLAVKLNQLYNILKQTNPFSNYSLEHYKSGNLLKIRKTKFWKSKHLFDHTTETQKTKGKQRCGSMPQSPNQTTRQENRTKHTQSKQRKPTTENMQIESEPKPPTHKTSSQRTKGENIAMQT